MTSAQPLCYVSLTLCLIAAGCSGGGGGSAPDTTAPSATITMNPVAAAPGSTVTATITFSENVSGLVASDLAVTDGLASTFTAVSGSVYTLAITADSAGVVQIALPAAACTDGAGNVNTAVSTQAPILGLVWTPNAGSDTHGPYATLTVTGHSETGVIQRFRLIDAGTFTMGSPVTEPGRGEFGRENQRQVTLTHPYWIADSECTQQMWKAVVGTTPSHFTAGGLQLPVDSVSWNDVQGFLTAVNGAHAGLGGRLPTDAEWQYACRAGTTGAFGISTVNTTTINCTPDATDPYIPTGMDRQTTVVVKSLTGGVNAWGLYDMHGNVAEWINDWHQNSLGVDPVTDPTGPASSGVRGVRGGAWISLGQYCRTANRDGMNAPSASNMGTGFRWVITQGLSGNG